MAAGFGMGPLYALPAAVRQRRLLMAGLASCAGFLLLRLINGYGDPVPWVGQPRGPPSLAFLLMTLGPGLLLLMWMERRVWHPGHPLVVFGRVPLFFYVGHFWVLHAMAALAAFAVYGSAARGFLWMPVPSMGGPANAFPPGFGYPLCGRPMRRGS